jgi:hypothetical protein
MAQSPQTNTKANPAGSTENAVSTSKLYMLRCVIAMAHADGIVTDAERAYISGIMNRLPLTEEQRRTLEGDLANPQNVEDMLRYINDPVYRGQVVDFARIMAFKDGHLDPSEEILLKKLNAHALDGVDLEAVKKTVNESVAREMQAYDLKHGADRPVSRGGKFTIPWFQMLDEVLLKAGIDLME